MSQGSQKRGHKEEETCTINLPVFEKEEVLFCFAAPEENAQHNFSRRSHDAMLLSWLSHLDQEISLCIKEHIILDIL